MRTETAIAQPQLASIDQVWEQAGPDEFEDSNWVRDQFRLMFDFYEVFGEQAPRRFDAFLRTKGWKPERIGQLELDGATWTKWTNWEYVKDQIERLGLPYARSW